MVADQSGPGHRGPRHHTGPPEFVLTGASRTDIRAVIQRIAHTYASPVLSEALT